MTRVVFCTPTTLPEFPFQGYLKSLDDTIVAFDEAGFGVGFVYVSGSCYISWARADMLKKAMDTDAEAVVFIDHDMSWSPEDMLRLVRHPGDVVAGDYRFKEDEEKYMARLAVDEDGRPIVRDDGTIDAEQVPAGFLKVTRKAVERFREAYPELMFGRPNREFVDLFNHGAYDGLWWGEDYAFSRRWRGIGGEIHLIPDLNLTHHLPGKAFPGNLHEFLLKQPGGSKEPQAKPEFSKRQADVLGLMKFGKPNKIIAHELGIEESSVKTHIRAIMKKLKATNRTEAVYKFGEMQNANHH